MPLNLMLMIKVSIMVLDLGVTLDLKFNSGEKDEPFIRRFIRRESFIDQYLYRASHSVLETAGGMLEMPRAINKTLRQLSTGTVTIDIVDSDILQLQ